MLLRISRILGRFGFTAERFSNMLERYSAVTDSLGCGPTFAVTAVVLARHPELMKELSRRGAEIAVHGYVHTDYKLVPLAQQILDFTKAKQTFENHHIPFIGFRAPFLRTNGKTSEALSRLRFSYDSSRTIEWDVLDKSKYSNRLWSQYDRLLGFYRPLAAEHYLALPRAIDGFIEIPISVPDDEAIVDRLCVTDEREISRIWRSIMERTYERGELFTVQLHPERIFICEGAVTDLLRRARAADPPVWVATLGEIARWWQEKKEFGLELTNIDRGTYRVRASCSPRATLLIRNSRTNVPTEHWSKAYRSIRARDFTVESSARPCIGVSPKTSPDAVRFLKSEGLVVEQSNGPGGHAIYFDNLDTFQESDEKALSESIEQSEAPLLRYWRWPNEARSALSITGDIDAMTLTDFALRIVENWRTRRLPSRNGHE